MPTLWRIIIYRGTQKGMRDTMKTRRQRFKEIVNDINTLDTIGMLFVRWQDEADYEDINDYLPALQKGLPDAVAMSDEPFGFDIDCKDGTLEVRIKTDGMDFIFETNIPKGGK